MSGKEWKRARSTGQIRQRENEILAAAEEIFRSTDYEKITMQMIARKSGFSQSNLYRYFKTREEIFLKIYISDMNIFKELADREFAGGTGIGDFAEKWTGILFSQKRLLELAPLLAVSLEKNTSDEVYRQAKKAIADQTAELGSVVSRALPDLNKEQIYGFLITNQALAAGAWPLAQFSERQLKIVRELGIEGVMIDFEEYFSSSILIYLNGLYGGQDPDKLIQA